MHEGIELFCGNRCGELQMPRHDEIISPPSLPQYALTSRTLKLAVFEHRIQVSKSSVAVSTLMCAVVDQTVGDAIRELILTVAQVKEPSEAISIGRKLENHSHILRTGLFPQP